MLLTLTPIGILRLNHTDPNQRNYFANLQFYRNEYEFPSVTYRK